MEMLKDLKSCNVLSATQACLLAFWAHKADAVGDVSKLGIKPGHQPGYYSTRYDKVVGTSPHDPLRYQVMVAKRFKYDAIRRIVPMPMILPHECLGEEVVQDPDVVRDFEKARKARDISARYFSHSFVTSCPASESVLPFVLYLDAVKYTRRDNILGLWCYLLISGERHLLFSMRKSEYCNCGCRGWCSLYPVLSALAWSCEAMGKGLHPAGRHDHMPWRAEDSQRENLADRPSGLRSLCLLVEGDWMEFAHSLGLPT